MTYYGKGHSRNTAPVRIQEHPKVDPLPSEWVDMRRNYGRGVCPYLLIAGESADPAEFTRSREGSYGSEIKDASCATRHTGITGAYVLDVCVTTWHDNPHTGDRCPFLPEVHNKDAAILAAYRGGESRHQIAKRLGVSPSYVYRLITRSERKEAA
jgi:hypothetical protein